MVPYARCSGMEMGKEVWYVSLLAKGTHYRHSLTVHHDYLLIITHLPSQ